MGVESELKPESLFDHNLKLLERSIERMRPYTNFHYLIVADERARAQLVELLKKRHPELDIFTATTLDDYSRFMNGLMEKTSQGILHPYFDRCDSKIYSAFNLMVDTLHVVQGPVILVMHKDAYAGIRNAMIDAVERGSSLEFDLEE